MAKTPDITALARLCDALSDQTRLRIFLLLTSGGCNFNGIYKKLKINEQLASHHLGLLRMNGVIVSQRHGRNVTYSLADNIKVSGSKVKISVPPFSAVVEI